MLAQDVESGQDKIEELFEQISKGQFFKIA
jgi:hypothetical protein